MALQLTLSRQRVPMLDASTLEDRTRPALDGSAASRLRYFPWAHWHTADERLPSYQVMSIRMRLEPRSLTGRHSAPGR